MKNTAKKNTEETLQNSQNNKTDHRKTTLVSSNIKKNKKIAIVTDDGVEDTEFFYPYYRFNEEGYEVDVITIEGKGFTGKCGLGLKESKSIDDASPGDYELIYLPGGKAPQKLRQDERILQFMRDFANNRKAIAAICHGPQILISAGLVKGRKIAAWPEMKEEIEKAGANFVDKAFQKDRIFMTARKPGDLPHHLYGILKYLNEKAQKNDF